MTKKLEVYKCEMCGNIAEVLHEGAGELVCCNQPMTLLQAKTEEQGYEKHLPVSEKTDQGLKVKIGSVPHPMEENHYIEWIEVIADGSAYRQFLSPGQRPESLFKINYDRIEVREFCNVHGLWSTKQ